MSGTTNISLATLCDQRKKQMLFNIPQARYTPQSPYNGTYTKFQLDMRRKAEILKYSNNTSSTKTNNLTRSEKFAQLVRVRSLSKGFQDRIITTLDLDGVYNQVTVRYPDKLVITSVLATYPGALQIVGYNGYFTYSIMQNGILVDCAADNLKPTSTSSCDVPGPIVQLIDDESVPLYNFLNYSISNAAYSSSQVSNISPWNVITNKNALLYRDIYSNIGTILINSIIDEPTKTFTVEVPMGIYAKNSPGIIDGSANIIIDRLYFKVEYSGSEVETGNSNPVLVNNLLRTPILVNYLELADSINGYNYFAQIDTASISNVFLDTSPGYVYDIFLSADLNTTESSFNDFTDNILSANYGSSVLDIR